MTWSHFLRADTSRVDIWLMLPTDVGRDKLKLFEGFLSNSERTRYLRFKNEEARRGYLVSRVLLRKTLSFYADVPPDAWEFLTGKFGRPSIAAPSTDADLRFSVSHTVGLVACAIGVGRDVGVDVETVDCGFDPIDIATEFFAPCELQALLSEPVGKRHERFFSYWTLKEAYAKATGMGLSAPLDAFWFSLDNGWPRICFGEGSRDDPKHWRFFQFSPTIAHKASLAIFVAGNDSVSANVHWLVPFPGGDGIVASSRFE
jgi:4'-phosphopantetheinyl transferase